MIPKEKKDSKRANVTMGVQSCMKFLILVLSISSLGPVGAISDPSWLISGQQPKRCSYQRAYSMLGAYCSELNLHILPTTLKSDIEILDASLNRIRELRNSSFESYTSLRFLYLRDNLIITIEPMAFEPLTYLEVLDLSLNGLATIPAPALNLPSLRKLYLSENALTNVHAGLAEIEKPIQAPLTFLNMAHCRLTAIPDFGVLSELEVFNASGNHFAQLRPLDFARMCALKLVDLNQSYASRDTCEVQMLISWFEDHAVQAIPLTMYSSENTSSVTFLASGCLTNGYDEETIKLHAECKTSVKTKQLSRSVKKTWIIIAGSLGGFLVAFMVILYLLHRRNVRQMKQSNERNEMEREIAEKSKTVDALLSDVS